MAVAWPSSYTNSQAQAGLLEHRHLMKQAYLHHYMESVSMRANGDIRSTSRRDSAGNSPPCSAHSNKLMPCTGEGANISINQP
jgi:hypothetical protein